MIKLLTLTLYFSREKYFKIQQKCNPVFNKGIHNLCSLGGHASKDFSKSEYYNYLFNNINLDNYTHVMFLDCDLILNESIYDMIEFDDKTISIIGGLKLDRYSTEYFYGHCNNYSDARLLQLEEKTLEENKKQFYIGNLVIPVKIIKLIQEITGKKYLYDNRFIGFGGEDNVLYSLLKNMLSKRLINLHYLFSAFLHLWHERNIDKTQYDKNVDLMNNLISENKNLLDKYCRINNV